MGDVTESMLATGCFVETLQGNVWQLAWVMEVQAGKVRLLLPNRKETSMQAARILPWLGPRIQSSDRDVIINALQEHTKLRTDLEKQFDALELWELAHGEMPCATPKWLAELIFDDPTPDHIAACAHALLQCKTHFKFQTPLFEILSEDIVAKRLIEHEAIQKREALVSEGGAFIRTLLDIYTKRCPPLTEEDTSKVPVETLDYIRRLIHSALLSPDGRLTDPAWLLLIKGIPEDVCLPLYLAQAWNMIEPHHNAYLERIGFMAGDAWSANHAEALCTLQKQVQEDSSLPFCDKPFVSIDNATTRDVDDAFFVEKRDDGGFDLYVALACPAWLWPFDSELDKAVRSRGTSVYLPEGTYHMMPECLGTDCYSLLAGQERPALVVSLRLASDGSVVSCEPQCARVSLAVNAHYAECEPYLIELADENLELSPSKNLTLESHKASLQAAFVIAQRFQVKRLEAGAVIIERPEPVFSLKNIDGEVHVSLDFEEEAPCSHTLVSEIMLLVNTALANWAMGSYDAEAFPFVYRTQHVDVPPACQGKWHEPLEIAQAVKALAPAMFSIKPLPHAGIGVSAYALCTSPLRRYMDLVNNAQILHFLQTKTPRWNAEALDTLVGEVQSNVDAVSQMQRFRNRYWKLLYIEQQSSQTWWPIVVTEIHAMMGIGTLLREQVLVRAKRALWPATIIAGQACEVRLRVDALHNEIQILEVRV